VAAFEAAIAKESRAELRKMFGYPAAFVNGSMATGLHPEDWMLRLGGADRAKLLAAGGAAEGGSPEGEGGREAARPEEVMTRLRT
jgi:hypothetical protein